MIVWHTFVKVQKVLYVQTSLSNIIFWLKHFNNNMSPNTHFYTCEVKQKPITAGEYVRNEAAIFSYDQSTWQRQIYYS